jgi:hypothetical protein
VTTRRRSHRIKRRKKGYGTKKFRDRYGEFDNGKQKTADIIAGVKVWYPREEEQ